MTDNDLNYIKKLLEQKKISEPVLELGAGYGGNTCRGIIESCGLTYFASDMKVSPRVDYVADFENENFESFFDNSVKFKSILALNVLEHTFNPILVLDNALKLLDNNGSLIVIAPSHWSLHNYPVDCYRFMPNFFEQYANTRNLLLDLGCFQYLGHGTIASQIDNNGDYRFPLPAKGFNYWKSRFIHRIFNTFGRGMSVPNCLAVGAVFTRKDHSTVR